MPGTLVVCAGPIGNLGDAPPRLAEALASADVVFAEDTRRARKLLDHLGVTAELRSYFVGNEDRRAAELSERLGSGATVALVTDAGTPSISDPGLSAVRVALDVGADITGVPGPSAVTLALALSGAPADRFVFEGFLPRSGRDRKERIAAIASETRTVVLFCAPSRLAADLGSLSAGMPDRPVAVCREMTKLYEEIWRGTLEEAAAEWAARKVKGEVTVVVWGGGGTVPGLDDALRLVHEAIDAGERTSEAVRRVAEETGVSRRSLYEAAIAEE